MKLEKGMEQEKNMTVMVILNLKVNMKMEKGMEQEKNITVMVI